jgi:hypothetical protein
VGLWDLATVTFGEDMGNWDNEPLRAQELIHLHLHVRATGQRELGDGRDEHAGCAYALGSRGPRLGTAVAPWSAYPELAPVAAHSVAEMDLLRFGDYSEPEVVPWPRPPEGVSGPLQALPRSGVAAFVDVLPGCEVEFRLELFDVRGHEMFADDWAELWTERWSGLAPEQEAAEAARLARATERHRRGALALDGEGPSDEEEDDDSYEAQYLAGCDEYI